MVLRVLLESLRNNMQSPTDKQIFRSRSSTFYPSAQMFPPAVRADVTKLYSFVRVADDYVDELPQQRLKFCELQQMWRTAVTDQNFNSTIHDDEILHERLIKNMVQLAEKYGFENAWVESFFASMRMDLDNKTYQTLNDSLEYVYGSAEVIGLMMAKIMGLPDEALPCAKMQGRAMQWINFIRDIAEDNRLCRLYFPRSELGKFGLDDLLPETIGENPENFEKFMHLQLNRYHKWQAEADEGFRYLPKRLRIPLQTSVDMYNWTVKQIVKNPMIVLARKVKPATTKSSKRTW